MRKKYIRQLIERIHRTEFGQCCKDAPHARTAARLFDQAE
jgi:hypothetical protein